MDKKKDLKITVLNIKIIWENKDEKLNRRKKNSLLIGKLSHISLKIKIKKHDILQTGINAG